MNLEISPLSIGNKWIFYFHPSPNYTFFRNFPFGRGQFDPAPKLKTPRKLWVGAKQNKIHTCCFVSNWKLLGMYGLVQNKQTHIVVFFTFCTNMGIPIKLLFIEFIYRYYYRRSLLTLNTICCTPNSIFLFVSITESAVSNRTCSTLASPFISF